MKTLHVTLFQYIHPENGKTVVFLTDLTGEIIRDKLSRADFLKWCNMWADIHDAFFEE